MIEIDDVFDAIMASGLRTLSNDERTDFLTFAFSTMALKIIINFLLRQQNQRFDLWIYQCHGWN